MGKPFFHVNKYTMQANTIPGTSSVYYNTTKVLVVITDLQRFYTYASETVDLAEERAKWMTKNRS